MPNRRGFTLTELLVVIAILVLLVSIFAPTMTGIYAMVQQTRCQANLDTIGKAVGAYAAKNNGYYIPGYTVQASNTLYYWGTNTIPVDATTAPLANYMNFKAFLCPALAWGDYVAQAGMIEPTTTYGYNAFCLDPQSVLTTTSARKTRDSILDPARLFVFVDSASTTLGPFTNWSFVDPLVGMPMRNPSTHFRHVGLTTNALCADGHAASFDTEGEGMDDTVNNLSFVGSVNSPHYGQ